MPLKPNAPRLRPGRPLNRGLVGAWLFSEGAGSRAYDASGQNALHLALGGTPAWLAGSNGPAVYLSSPQDALKSAFPFYPEITFLARIRRRGGIGSGFQSVAAHHSTSGVASDWYLYFAADNKLHIDIPWVAGDVAVSASAVSDTAREHAIGFSRSGSAGSWTYKVYIDGKLDASANTSANPAASSWDLYLSKFIGGSPLYGDSNFIEARLWCRALLPSEVLQFGQTDYSEFRPPKQILTFSAPAATVVVPVLGGLTRRGITGGRMAA